MAKKLKVYSGTIYVRSTHPAASANGSGQVRYVVAASSIKAAAAILGVKPNQVSRYGSETGNRRDIEVALAHSDKALVYRGYGADREWFDLDGNPIKVAPPEMDKWMTPRGIVHLFWPGAMTLDASLCGVLRVHDHIPGDFDTDICGRCERALRELTDG